MNPPNVQEWFHDTAARHAARPAVEHDGRVVTYAELQARVARLANWLHASGARPGAVVGVMSRAPVDYITGLLGSLTAGAIYVPLSESAPAARLTAQLARVRPTHYLAGDTAAARRLADLSPAAAQGLLLSDDGSTAATALESSAAIAWTRGSAADDERVLPIALAGDAPCYVFFTSGSTGEPKGITGRLKAIDHYVRWELTTCGLTAPRVSQLMAPVFDASLRDVLVPLCSGGTVCVPPVTPWWQEPATTSAWLDTARIELVHTVPSLFRLVLQPPVQPTQWASLKWMLLAGEVLRPADVGHWFDLFGGRIGLMNLYGPSETTMTKFFHIVRPEDRDRLSVPIGRPMEGAKAVVLGPRDSICPVGAIGEIHLRTPYRSLGYWEQPELTADVFVPNPFGSDPTDLVYRTGDLGRVLEDGNFEFLGRRDQQVKIHGVRIELGEIEAALLAEPEVTDAVVVDREEGDGHRYLCAYVVLAEGDWPSIQARVRARLPDALVPARAVVMDTLPRTLTGKVDRRSLPAPAITEDAWQSPRTLLEELIAGIWAEVLGLTRVSATANFFELGGHSLLATLVVSRIRGVCGVDVPLRRVFEQPTVAGLAAAIEDVRGQDGLTRPAMTAVAAEGVPLPLSHAQQRLWFVNEITLGEGSYNMSAALRLRGTLDRDALAASLTEVVRRHQVLRTSFALGPDGPVQVVGPAVPVSIPVDTLTGEGDAPLAAARACAAEEAQTPIDLRDGRLMRARLLSLGPDDHVLLVTLHHIASDGWSVAVLVREVSALYASLTAGTGIAGAALPALPLQYGDYAAWQRQAVDDDALTGRLAYWRRHLAAAPVEAIPPDAPPASTPQRRGVALDVPLPPSLAEAVRALSRRQGVTLSMTLLAAVGAAVHFKTGADDVVIGTDFAGRDSIALEGLIGFFVNQLPIRIRLGGAVSFLELMTQVRETFLQADLHSVPMDVLVRHVAGDRDPDASPLFQTLFVMQNAPAQALVLPGLEVELLADDTAVARSELTLFVVERGDELALRWVYRAGLFRHDTIARLADLYMKTLEAATAAPDTRLADLRARLATGVKRQLAALRS